MEDLVLVHHWTIHTSRSLVNSPDLDHYWHTIFPQLGFQYPFVLHAILSIASLHLAYTRPSERTERMLESTRYHNTALKGFIESLNGISISNCHGLFACATLNIIYVFGMHGNLNDGTETNADDRHKSAQILGEDWIPIIRGIQAVLAPMYDHIKLGVLGPLLDLDNWEGIDPDTVPEAELQPFRDVQETWSKNNDSEVYDRSLYLLRKAFAYTKQFESPPSGDHPGWGYNRSWSAPLIWLYSAPEEYFTLLHQRQPPALILFAHCGALLHTIDRIWFAEGWGSSIVRVVSEVLGSYWSPWLKWPRGKVGLV